MELDELLKEARIRYPVGTKYMTMAKKPIMKIIENEVKWSDSKFFIIDNNDYIIYITSSNEWAEIVSVPDINYSYLIKLLKKLGIR